MRNNISFPFLIKSATCTSIMMYIKQCNRYKTPSLDLHLNRTNTISRIPDFIAKTGISIYTVSCFVEIPINHIGHLFHNPEGKELPWYEVKTVYWSGVLYRRLSQMSRFGPDSVSWEVAARSCLKAGQSLLTVHSMAEFDFVKETFLSNQDTPVVYVGLMRKVIYLNNSLI